MSNPAIYIDNNIIILKQNIPLQDIQLETHKIYYINNFKFYKFSQSTNPLTKKITTTITKIMNEHKFLKLSKYIIKFTDEDDYDEDNIQNNESKYYTFKKKSDKNKKFVRVYKEIDKYIDFDEVYDKGSKTYKNLNYIYDLQMNEFIFNYKHDYTNKINNDLSYIRI